MRDHFFKGKRPIVKVEFLSHLPVLHIDSSLICFLSLRIVQSLAKRIPFDLEPKKGKVLHQPLPPKDTAERQEKTKSEKSNSPETSEWEKNFSSFFSPIWGNRAGQTNPGLLLLRPVSTFSLGVFLNPGLTPPMAPFSPFNKAFG